MSQSPAIRRLKKEYASLLKSPPSPSTHVRPLESNFLHAHFLLTGHIFHDTPYEGGVYHGTLKFPPNYPLAPPTVTMRTPSGRFEVDRKICFSMSDFHPELWNPMWSIRSIVIGLVSFMNSEEITTGGVRADDGVRIRLARESLDFCLEKDELALQLFRDELESIAKERQEEKTNNINANGDNDGSSWPPKRRVEETIEVPTKLDTPSKERARIRAPRLTSQKAANPNNKKDEHNTNQLSERPTDTATATKSNSKNAAKNKKKREKEKRKKIYQKFTSNLSQRVPQFLAALHTALLQKDPTLDVSSYHADHICWRTRTMEEYTLLISTLSTYPEEWTLLIESDVGGRPIATFRMKEGIPYSFQGGDTDRTIDVVEIPAPKDASPYETGLEHVEFVIGSSLIDASREKILSPLNDDVHRTALNDFMEKHPGLEWSKKAMGKESNPDVSTKIELPDFGTCSVKFHLMALAEVVEYEVNNK